MEQTQTVFPKKQNKGKKQNTSKWTDRELETLVAITTSKIGNKWKIISKIIQTKTSIQCCYMHRKLIKAGIIPPINPSQNEYLSDSILKINEEFKRFTNMQTDNNRSLTKKISDKLTSMSVDEKNDLKSLSLSKFYYVNIINLSKILDMEQEGCYSLRLKMFQPTVDIIINMIEEILQAMQIVIQKTG